jgi:hypothetical protein
MAAEGDAVDNEMSGAGDPPVVPKKKPRIKQILFKPPSHQLFNT